VAHLALHSFPTRRSSDLIGKIAECPSNRRRRRIVNDCKDNARRQHSTGKIDERKLCTTIDCNTVSYNFVRAASVTFYFAFVSRRSEEHTSELQSPYDLVC